MRSLGVVILLPGVDDHSGMGETAKPVQIQAFITKLAVEALDVGVLGGLAWLDEVQGDAAYAMRVRPCIQHLPGKLRAIVDRDLFRHAMRGDELVEDARDALARQRGIDLNGQALSSDQIKDVERTKPAAVDQHILHEVHTPGLAPLPGLLLDARAGTATRLRLRRRMSSPSAR